MQFLQIFQQAIDLVDSVTSPQPKIGRDLVVSAARGVEFAADVPQAINQRLLDIHVNIFQRWLPGELTGIDFGQDFIEAVDDLFRLLRLDQPLLAKHSRVNLRCTNVLSIHLRIEGNAFGKRLNALIDALVKGS